MMFSKTRELKKYHLIFFVLLISFIAPAGASHLDALNNSCIDCHKTVSPFTDEQSRFNEIRTNHTERNISCSLECHADIIRKKATDNFQQWSESGHSAYYVTCDACHGGNPRAKTEAEAHAAMKSVGDANSTLYFKNVPEMCGKCHAEELDHFRNTMHYQRLKSESRAPSCVTCHQPHTFKVLKAPELTPLCSICHNPNDHIATAGVPRDAKNALEKANELQAEVVKAKNIVSDAKAKGKDVTSAQSDLDKAAGVLDDIPSLWHSFNLRDFDRQINSGIDMAKRAQSRVSGVEPTVPPRTPGTGIALAIGILAAVYLIRRR